MGVPDGEILQWNRTFVVKPSHFEGRVCVPAKQIGVAGHYAAEVVSPTGNRRKINVGSDGNYLPLTVTLNAARGLGCYDGADGGGGVGEGQGGAGAKTMG